jgi:hypothetical protein
VILAKLILAALKRRKPKFPKDLSSNERIYTTGERNIGIAKRLLLTDRATSLKFSTFFVT